MSSGQPLLSPSEPSSVVHHCRSPRSLDSIGFLDRNVSVSSSDVEEGQSGRIDHEEDKEEEATTVVGTDFGLSPFERRHPHPTDKKFRSAELHIPQQFSLAHPTKERRNFVSGGAMELHNNSRSASSFEISGEKFHKSSRARSKSAIFENNLLCEENARLVYINDPWKTNDNYEFTGNEIRTSKYTLITFLPKNLFIQFHRVAYLYFLAIAALNQLPPLAVFGRTVSLFPLLFVLCVTAIKDGYEDWRRHRSDRNENNREALVLQFGEFRMKSWKKIQAGEVVKIHADESIPCDMVLLCTSDPSGLAYIQTMNLDGESNLKTRYARQETTSSVFEGCSEFGLIKCEQPNRNIYEFTATMEFNGQQFPLSQSNIVLRGCQLKNTDWIIGVVVYAGQETKAMLNSAVSPCKRSKLESYMNRETLWLSIFLFIMCLVVALGSGFWLQRHKKQLDTSPYYRKRDFNKAPHKNYKYYGIPLESLISFLSSVIVFQIMIPISLYITMELVRLGQSYFMIEDRHMFDSSSGSRFQCRSLNINEDLGQVRYVFSDKTGTLTENKMEFRRASVYGKNYGSSLPVGDLIHDHSVQDTGCKRKSQVLVDLELMELLHQKAKGDETIAAHEFFLALAVCNTVVPIHGAEEDLGAIEYQGESPDEQALVCAARAYGYTLFERTSGHVVIDVKGEKLRLDVIGLHEFDSVRKRMSVVIRYPNNDVKVLVKGADTSMFSILANYERVDQLRQETHSHLIEYSQQGLRTLVIAAKDLTDTELDQWQQRYGDASTSLIDRAAKLRLTASLIECNLNLLGATGIEDKLQDGVPEAIEALREAGIKVWVLTGDKQETAISIGLSCKLLTADMRQIIINGHSEDECRNLLADAKAKYIMRSMNKADEKVNREDENVNPYLAMAYDPKLSFQEDMMVPCAPLALIIDGNSLVYILEKDLESDLFDLAIACRVVLCCRVAPLQKAGIVDLIKSRTDDMTLAIGDGANDVSMIQMADVGVGICGQEGRQAVMASDFAMGQFRFLKRLLLVHGHWNYQRVAYLVLYNFYRNAVFVLMLFWYILFAAFSTTSALTDWSSVFYSVIYTSIPTIIVGILDKDLSHRTLLKHPKLYGVGHRHEAYNMRLFWFTMVDTLWQSLALFYVPLLTYKEGTIDIWSIGSLWTIAVVILVNIHLAMDIQRWVFVTHLAVWGSIMITYACMVVLDSIPVFPNYGTIYYLVTTARYWLTILLIIVVGLLPRFLVKVMSQAFWPSDIQIAREAERLDKRRGFLRRKPGHEPDHDAF
ncbi:PREDICTED: phospholipid-transporting ATPase 1-like [Tarenaya hassleriana]|uniref:phospholipid-transporting ATPase 1-like n=1 Tax=Tarenaya hassleriana TaxID=28532 RepID=UPI00053C6CC4|nr:PREDICTED: phospholipid-transporting ATPase 1-like [Tarenaya hassleriana]